MHELISDYATSLGVEIKLGEQVVDYINEGTEGIDRQAGVVCKSGLKLMGDVVLCCDGPKSLARQKVLGLADTKVSSGYAIFRAHYFLTPEMRKNIHLSRFCGMLLSSSYPPFVASIPWDAKTLEQIPTTTLPACGSAGTSTA